MKSAKIDEQSILRIFIRDITYQESELRKRFYKRATKLFQNKAITKGTLDIMKYRVKIK